MIVRNGLRWLLHDSRIDILGLCEMNAILENSSESLKWAKLESPVVIMLEVILNRYCRDSLSTK